MILFDAVVEVFAAPDMDQPQSSARPIQQSVLGVTGDNRLPVRLTAVDDDALRAAMARQSLMLQAEAKKP